MWSESSPPILDMDHARASPKSPRDTGPIASVDLGSIVSMVMLKGIVRLADDRASKARSVKSCRAKLSFIPSIETEREVNVTVTATAKVTYYAYAASTANHYE